MADRNNKLKGWYEKRITKQSRALAARSGRFSDGPAAEEKISGTAGEKPLPVPKGPRSVPAMISRRNQKHNAAFPATRSYIGKQGGGGAADHLRFGLFSMSFNGCEVIAVYNLLKYLGHFEDIRDIAADFERRGAIILGGFGTRPAALCEYISSKTGMDCLLYTPAKDRNPGKADDTCDEWLAGTRAAVFTFWNGHQSWTIHTVMIAPLKNGKIRVFNRYPDRLFRDYDSIEALLNAPEDPLRVVSMITVR